MEYRKFNEKWKKCKLYDLATWKNGLAFKQISFSNKGYPIIKIAELKNGITKQTNYTKQNYDKDVFLRYDDLVFSWSGNPETSIDAFLYRLPDGYLNQHIFKVTSKEGIDKYFLYYILKYLKPAFKSIATNKQTTGLGHVTIGNLKEMDVAIPNYIIQRKIMKILKNIDDKIELNNKINNNLYEVGIELLKNDFILEKGMETLSQVIKFVKGKKPSDISTNKQVGYEKYLTIACLNGQELNYADTNKMIMSNNDLLMVMDGASSGEVYCGGHGIVGSTLARIDCTDNNYISEFIFFCLKYYKDLIQSKNTGSAIPHTDKVFVGSLEIPKINIEKQEKYNVLLSKIQHNQNENKTLENLRNALLPKLMNGEIDLDKIEI